MARILVALLAFLGLAATAGAATVRLSHPYGELIDRGSVAAELNDLRFGCAPPVTMRKRDGAIDLDVRRLPAGAPDEACVQAPTVDLGELSAGWWTVTMNVYEAGGPIAETVRVEVRVRVPETSCNRDAWRGSELIVLHRTLTGTEIARRLGSDPALAAYLGGAVYARSVSLLPERDYAVIGYPPLDNVWDKRALLERTGDFLHVQDNGPGCFATLPGGFMGTVVEYHHAQLDHYFYTANADEIRSLDDGSGARGWTRSGKTFIVLLTPSCPPERVEQGAYRFFGRPGVGPSSHVFTVDREECRIVDKSGAWLYEGSPFWATPPNSMGACTDALEIPLHRVWKPFGESNHRFTTELAVVDEMKAKGWVHEGVAMCVKKALQ